jgi:hypothetical protein
MNCAFANKKIDMGLLKCDIKMEDSRFTRGGALSR